MTQRRHALHAERARAHLKDNDFARALSDVAGACRRRYSAQKFYLYSPHQCMLYSATAEMRI